jgi:hypothetical protein
MRKHLGWYAKGRDDRPGLRAQLVQARELADVEYLLADLAIEKAVDARRNEIWHRNVLART